MSIAEADGLTLAGINGTILTIVVAGLTGFFFLAFQTLDRMETELVEEANRANLHRFIQLGGDSPPFSTKGLGIARLRSLFMALAHGDAREHEESGPLLPQIDLPPQDDLVARGSALISVMAAVGSCYPFVAKDGEVTPLRLNDVPTVLEWLPDFEVALWSLSGNLRDTRDYVARLAAARDDASAELNQKYLEGVRAYRSHAGLPAAGRPSNEILREHALSLDRFIDFVEASSEIARTTRARFETLKRYRQRLPSRTLVLAATFVVLVAFTCGVAIPMIHPTVNSAVDAWVPVALYALSLGFGAIQITRRYQQQGTGRAESQFLRP
jgi:hypothetical protein